LYLLLCLLIESISETTARSDFVSSPGSHIQLFLAGDAVEN
jgi:hypothetical protein